MLKYDLKLNDKQFKVSLNQSLHYVTLTCLSNVLYFFTAVKMVIFR